MSAVQKPCNYISLAKVDKHSLSAIDFCRGRPTDKWMFANWLLFHFSLHLVGGFNALFNQQQVVIISFFRHFHFFIVGCYDEYKKPLGAQCSSDQ